MCLLYWVKFNSEWRITGLILLFNVENFHLIFIRHYEMFKILYFYHDLKHAFVIIKFYNRRSNAGNVYYYFGESFVVY